MIPNAPAYVPGGRFVEEALNQERREHEDQIRAEREEINFTRAMRAGDAELKHMETRLRQIRLAEIKRHTAVMADIDEQMERLGVEIK